MTTERPAGQPRIPHVPALDGLRGAAVVGVLLFHSGHLRGGYLGVDLFFVLSGFLITSLLLAEWRHGTRIHLGAFWVRRARRLLPALLLVVLAVGGYAAFVAAPTELARIRSDALATLGYVANWHSIGSGNDYWALFRAPSPFEHTWSLAIEEQFYLVWPVIFVAVGAIVRRTRRPIAPVVLAVAGIGGAGFATLALVLASGGASDARVYFGTDTRAPAILLGASLAALVAWRGTTSSTRGRVALEAVGLAGVGWLAWAWVDLGGQDRLLLRGGLLASGVAAVAVLAAAAHPLRGPIAIACSAVPLRLLGLVSYGLYLWHWPVFVWLDQARTGLDGWGLTAVRVGVSLAIAVVSYTLVEAPIRRGALRGRPIRVVAPVAIIVTIAIALVATAGAVAQPTTEDTIIEAKRLVTAAPSSTAPTDPTTRRLLVVGDSVAQSLGVQFDAIETTEGIDSFNGGVVACQIPRGDVHRAPLITSEGPPPEITTKEVCRQWPERWRDEVAALQPTDVLLALGAPGVEDEKVGGRWLTACSPEWDEFYRSEVVDALTLLASGGATVWVASIAPPPTPEIFPPSWLEVVQCGNDVLRAAITASPGHDRFIDLAHFVCPKGVCHAEIDGKELRQDWVHFTGEGGTVVARWLLDQMTTTPRVG